MTKKEFVSMSLPYGLKALIPESDKKRMQKNGELSVDFHKATVEELIKHFTV